MLFALAFAFGAFCMFSAEATYDSNAMTQTAPDTQTQVIVAAATAFLNSLSAEQRTQVYSPQSVGGDPTKHIHTIYRDPTDNYGAKWLKQHD